MTVYVTDMKEQEWYQLAVNCGYEEVMYSGCWSVTKSINNLIQYRKERGALFILWIFVKPTVGSPAMAAKEEENKRGPAPLPSDTRKLLSSIYGVFQEL